MAPTTRELVVASTLDGWLATKAGRSTTFANPAGDEVVFSSTVGQPGQGRLSGLSIGVEMGDRISGSIDPLSGGISRLGLPAPATP